MYVLIQTFIDVLEAYYSFHLDIEVCSYSKYQLTHSLLPGLPTNKIIGVINENMIVMQVTLKTNFWVERRTH